MGWSAEIAVSCESATGDKAVFYLKQADGTWEPHDIGGSKAQVRPYLVVDPDGDGDLDLLPNAISMPYCGTKIPRGSCVKRLALPALHL